MGVVCRHVGAESASRQPHLRRTSPEYEYRVGRFTPAEVSLGPVNRPEQKLDGEMTGICRKRDRQPDVRSALSEMGEASQLRGRSTRNEAACRQTRTVRTYRDGYPFTRVRPAMPSMLGIKTSQESRLPHGWCGVESDCGSLRVPIGATSTPTYSVRYGAFYGSAFDRSVWCSRSRNGPRGNARLRSVPRAWRGRC